MVKASVNPCLTHAVDEVQAPHIYDAVPTILVVTTRHVIMGPWYSHVLDWNMVIRNLAGTGVPSRDWVQIYT